MRRAVVILAGLLVFALGCSEQARAADVAIIVHPSNPQTDISVPDLVQVFKMEQQHWASGGRIYVVLLESGTSEKDLVLRKLYRMKDADLKQYYLGKLYRGEIASFPTIAHSNTAARRLVSQAPNAISFVAATLVDASVKALRIDGKKPGDAGYLLAARTEDSEASTKP